MQYIFLLILAVPFLFLNYKIIISDLKIKKIPNKYLLQLIYLLPLYYVYIFIFFPNISFLYFIGQIILTFLISFLLFNFSIWSAGDAKYLLVLSLFLPHIGIIPLIGNIALLTLFYLLLYFIWFYLGKCIFQRGYAKDLYKNIKIDLKSKWSVYKKKKGDKERMIVFKWIFVFLLFFVIIRLIKIYIFANLFQNKSNIILLGDFFQKYNFYLVFLFGLLGIGLFFLYQKMNSKIREIFLQKKIVNKMFITRYFLYILFIGLVVFILFEYQKSPIEIQLYLTKIFTIYLALWVFFRIILYGYNLTFGVSEHYFIPISNLKEGDIVDKKYLQKIFGYQQALGYGYEGGQKEKDYLYIDPQVFFSKIHNPIDKQTVLLLQKIYSLVHKYHIKQKSKNYIEIKDIKLIHTFSFGIYIFLGFIITFIFSNSTIISLINIIFYQ